MIRILLFGAGNVAEFLFEAFSQSKTVKVVQVFNHSPANLTKFEDRVEVTSSLDTLAEADVYLLAIKDDAIEDLAARLKTKDVLAVHTSGAVSMNALKTFERRGVFYPLQTFSKNRQVINRNIPFCLETNNPSDLELLQLMTSEISGTAYEVSSEQRKKLHLAAVFVCNFVNHLYTVGEEICEENELPFQILEPLIKETAEKIAGFSPRENQTGPAIRNDLKTIETHLGLISSRENKDIYQLLTHAIQSSHGKKL